MTAQRPSGPTIAEASTHIASAVLDQARSVGVATLHEAAGRIGALPSAIKPVNSTMRLCGRAITVHSPAGDNLWLHRAIYLAEPGDVLVVYASGGYEYGYWGEIMSCAAKARKLGGLVIDACVRDGAILDKFDFPVFARGLCIRGTGKDLHARGWINHPVMVGDIVVNPGDLVAGDTDGVVVIPNAKAQIVAQASVERESKESTILERIANGERTLEVYHFD
jgi:4-hydroxy-4-methyl-2-oxoglutarate aldolase